MAHIAEAEPTGILSAPDHECMHIIHIDYNPLQLQLQVLYS